MRGEDGEFELILGNRQLLSVFFIVVVLLGVFFTMGYIVGKNAGPVMASTQPPVVVDGSRTQPSPPPGGLIVDPRSEPGRSKPSAMPEPVPDTRPEPPVQTASLAEKNAAARPNPQESRPEPPKPEAKKSEPKPEPAAAKPAPAPAPAPALNSGGDPAPGQTFLQVVASTRPDCEMIASVLKRKGFSASVVPGPKENVFRVLVGPLADAASISKTRTDLEGVGFQKPLVRKY